MNILKTLQIIAVIGTILTGLVSLIWPLRVQGFTGLTAPGGRGITEIRSILGALFIGLGIAVFLLGNTPKPTRCSASCTWLSARYEPSRW